MTSRKQGGLLSKSILPFNLYRLRLEIMDAMSTNLEQGYEKILRYCSNEFRQIGRDSHLEVNQVTQEAVFRLRKRPELLT